MTSFYIYDISFLILFTLGISYLIYRNKKKAKRDGIIFMFRTQFGTKIMEKIDKKFHPVIRILRYFIIILGFILMVSMISLLIQSLCMYITNPELSQQIKAPPIAPLIPYFPELFGMESYFPPFYFTYFIIAISIVSIFHEFAHGVLMKYSKTKIKSTGFMFLGPILGFFVEQDDKDFKKKKRIDQMATLGAGVFSNIMVAVIFYLLYISFFSLVFQPIGYSFDMYSLSILNTSNIDDIYLDGDYGVITIEESKYFIDKNNIESIDKNNSELIYAYDNTPAFRNKLKGIILHIDDFAVYDQKSLSQVMSSYNPGDNAIISTLFENQVLEFNITFDKHPENESKPYLGIAKYDNGKKGVSGILSNLMNININEDDYETKINKEFAVFILYLFWWIMIINMLVALFNMLPWGMLDGGRFLELGIGKFVSEKRASLIVKIIGKIILGILIFMTILWFVRLF